jgi:membrane-associated phospholipid phosphatase
VRPGPTIPAWRALAITIAATAVAMLVDRTVYEFINAPTVYDKDLGRLLRVMGFAGTWLALALAVGLQHDGDESRISQGRVIPPATSRTTARRRGWLIFWSPMLAGALAEVLKIVVRRERPALNDGAYGFREWSERTFSSAGLAFPSSHTAVAFGGAFMLGRIFPKARWVGYALAAGCGITRILARAHFVSDVVFAAGLGWLVSWLLWRKWQPRVAALGLLAALLASPQNLQAQADDIRPAPNLPCIEYERCALTLLPKFTGLVVARGVDETPLATLGFFLPGKRLDAVFAGDTAAVRFGREALDQRRIGALLTIGSLVTFAVATVMAIDADATGSSADGIFLAAAAQAGGAVYYQFKADASLSRAVWYYNRRFAR